MTDLFKDILPSIMQSKKIVIGKWNEKEYTPFVVNRALSFHYDCALQANEMNKFPNLPGTMQYHYLLNTVRGYKRPFRKWEKREIIDKLEMIKQYYNYSYEKAKDVLPLISEDHMIEIQKSMNKGGVVKK